MQLNSPLSTSVLRSVFRSSSSRLWQHGSSHHLSVSSSSWIVPVKPFPSAAAVPCWRARFNSKSLASEERHFCEASSRVCPDLHFPPCRTHPWVLFNGEMCLETKGPLFFAWCQRLREDLDLVFQTLPSFGPEQNAPGPLKDQWPLSLIFWQVKLHLHYCGKSHDPLNAFLFW